MAFSRSLLIKGLAGGLGACTACAGGVGIYKYSASEEDIEKLSIDELIERVGLDCSEGDDNNKTCSVKDQKKINIDKKGAKTEEVTFTAQDNSKVRLHKDADVNEYEKGVKFSIEGGDISLTGDNSNNTKLEEFETYEIKKEGDKWYLSLKDGVEESKTKILVLPERCTLPIDEGNTKSCTLSAEEIKKVKFNGQTEGVTVTGTEKTSLTITKTKDTTTFTEGYKLTFTFPSEVTINSKSVKANTPTDYKIKKENNSLSLEKAWEDDKLIEKIGLSCNGGSDNECSIPSSSSEKLNVKVGEKTKEGINSLGSSSGKIKLEKEQAGYNEGLKFTITTGDISPTGGGDVSKLEEFETYEITEEGGKYYLTRKTDKGVKIKTALGLPNSCDLPTENVENECIIYELQAKDVKFDGQPTSNSGLMYRLKVENVNDTAYPHGYKFTLMSDKDVSISNDLTIKGNTNTVFKIKKDGTNLSLEKAWSDNNTFTKKAGLDCSNSNNTECSVSSDTQKLNVKIGDNKKENIASINGGGKIKIEKDQAGYNQGLKFTITTGDVTWTNDDQEGISKLEELETYEITEEGDKYYLTRKTTKEEAIKKSLSIPDECFTSTPGSDACSPLGTTDLSKINFDGKTEGTNRFDGEGKAYLTISKVTNTTDFPLGYRFAFLTTGDMTISETNTVKANIPTDFKIKKENNTLSLVKAWNSNGDNLIAKVGLENCSTGNEGCTIKTTGTTTGLNVKQGETAYDNKTKSSSSPQGKIKLYKEQKGYLEGFKFVIEENDITLDNGDSSTIKLTQFETYGIEENGGKYYLTKKTDGREEKIRNLGFSTSECEWKDFSSPFHECSITFDELKEVKFKGKKDSQSFTGSGNIKVMFAEVKEVKDTSTHPQGLKVSFISTSDISIPLSSSTDGGAIVLKQSKKKEFKITKETGGNLTLERAFNINEFVKDVGLENCYDNLGCSLKDKISVWLDEKNYSDSANVVNGGSTENKVIYEEIGSGGYEFTPKSSITLQKGDAASGGAVQKGEVTSLSTSDKFQVMQQDVDGTKHWFLTKVKKK